MATTMPSRGRASLAFGAFLGETLPEPHTSTVLVSVAPASHLGSDNPGFESYLCE